MSEIERSPVIGVYILDVAGVPLLARHYMDKIAMNEAIIFAGFFSAIETFTRLQLRSNLTDIGITDKRFFLQKAFDKYVKVVIVQSDGSYTPKEKINLIELVHDKIDHALDAVDIYAEENQIDSVDDLIKELGMTIDSLVFECNIENAEKISDEIPVDIEKGISIEIAKDKVKDIFK